MHARPTATQVTCTSVESRDSPGVGTLEPSVARSNRTALHRQGTHAMSDATRPGPRRRQPVAEVAWEVARRTPEPPRSVWRSHKYWRGVTSRRCTPSCSRSRPSPLPLPLDSATYLGPTTLLSPSVRTSTGYNLGPTSRQAHAGGGGDDAVACLVSDDGVHRVRHSASPLPAGTPCEESGR
ncbi:hypothetical protein OH76DRAFT_1558911 [Lentinus brumalis]|uniref:Uncharacterized protein n=1 Tax=Lentinus brumalis TaxID=2498619 RepID=A0A371CZY4_9APHY|nr:hypothetical protein OH76DRAFT_1558911 [Polyporus brumalis]